MTDTIDPLIQQSAERGSGAAIAAIVIWALVAVLKREDIPLIARIPLPPRARPVLALALGQAYAVLEAVVGGMSWRPAIVRGLVAACAAIAAHEVASKAKAPPMGPVLALVLGTSSLVSCTPQARADARMIGVPVTRVVGAVCERLAGATGEPWVDFSCQVVRAAGDVLGNMSADGTGSEHPEAVGEPFVVRVPAEQADAFETEQRGRR